MLSQQAYSAKFQAKTVVNKRVSERNRQLKQATLFQLPILNLPYFSATRDWSDSGVVENAISQRSEKSQLISEF